MKIPDEAFLDATAWMKGSPPHDWTIEYERQRLKRILGFEVEEKTWTMLKGLAYRASYRSLSSPEKWLRYYCDCLIKTIKGTEALSLELGRQLGKVVEDTTRRFRQFIIDCPQLDKKEKPLRAKKEPRLVGWYPDRPRIRIPELNPLRLRLLP